MKTDTVDLIDKSRVRNRMGLDVRQWSRLLKSEIENYNEHFSATELIDISNAIKALNKIGRKL